MYDVQKYIYILAYIYKNMRRVIMYYCQDSIRTCLMSGNGGVTSQQQRRCILQQNKVFRHVETLFVQGRNLYPAGLLLVIKGLFTFRQPVAGLQSTDLYLGRIKLLHVERPYTYKLNIKFIITYRHILRWNIISSCHYILNIKCITTHRYILQQNMNSSCQYLHIN